MRPLVADLLRRWFAVAGGMGAYAVVLVLGFWLVPVACQRTGTWVLHLVMAAGLAVALASLAVAWALWRGAPRPPEPPEPVVRGAAGWVHVVGVLTRRTWLGALGLVWGAITGGGADRSAEEDGTSQRQREMAVVGVVLGVLSVLLVVFHWVPVFVLGPCG